jgi:serine/threonine-protein kinase RsbW
VAARETCVPARTRRASPSLDAINHNEKEQKAMSYSELTVSESVPRDEETMENCGRWVHFRLSTGYEARPLLERMAAWMEAEGYPHSDCMGMRLALEEAVANALRHGNHYDPAKRVRVGLRVNACEALAEVEDEGPGFDPDSVLDPTAAENLDKPSGRGLLLMRHFTTWVRFHGRGNLVTLCRTRTRVPPS